MDRLACISVPSLPLQIALRRFPPGEGRPIALVREDRPTSPILQLNRAARERGLRSGMRYSEALSLVGELQAVLVSPDDLARARQEILETLTRWSPQIEACPFEQGSFWLGCSGLTSLYGSEAEWGSGVRSALAQKRYHAAVVIGFTRGGTYILARSRRRSTAVRSWQAEKRALDDAPLSLVPLVLRHRRLLERLGVKTLAALVQIPVDELARRFGHELVKSLKALEAYTGLPLQTVEKEAPWSWSLRLETPVSDRQALLPLLSGPLREGLSALQRRARLLDELRLVLVLESRELVCEVLRPAEPTTREATVARLLELRLGHCVFATGVVELRLVLHDVAGPAQSGDLFEPPPERDARRGAEALAVLRAQWGDGAVVRPVLVDSHVPELSYRWEELERLVRPVPRPAAVAVPTAVRRVPRGSTVSANPSGQRLGGSCRLRVLSGPPVDREYWFLRNPRREVAWVSWDRLTGTSRWEGMVD